MTRIEAIALVLHMNRFWAGEKSSVRRAAANGDNLTIRDGLLTARPVLDIEPTTAPIPQLARAAAMFRHDADQSFRGAVGRIVVTPGPRLANFLQQFHHGAIGDEYAWDKAMRRLRFYADGCINLMDLASCVAFVTGDRSDAARDAYVDIVTAGA